MNEIKINNQVAANEPDITENESLSLAGHILGAKFFHLS